MEAARFGKVATDMKNMLTAAIVGAGRGDTVFYNAYFNGTEVVVLGYQYEEGGHTITKPIAIAVDPEVMTKLRVDSESGRYEDGPGLQDPKVV